MCMSGGEEFSLFGRFVDEIAWNILNWLTSKRTNSILRDQILKVV